jgi:5-methylcytosine-specific restriction endonuclease McrA
MTRSEAGKLGAQGLRAKRIRQANIKAWDANPKRCETCSGPLAYPQRHCKFCSHSCFARTMNGRRRRSSRPRLTECLECGTALRLPGKRRYCSRRCHQHAAFCKRVANWKEGSHKGYSADEHTSVFVRRYMLQRAGYVCSQCGWDAINPWTKRSPLHIDHIDGNATNNKEENLRVLCPNCHSLTKTYGAANRGRGRKARRDQYLPKTKRALVA